MKRKVILGFLIASSLMFNACAMDVNSIRETDEPVEVQPADSYIAVGAGTVEVSGVNVRNNPNLEADIIDVLPQGSTIIVLSIEGNWYYISYGNTTGYVYSPYLTVDENSDNEFGVGQVNCSVAIIRDDNDTESNIAGFLTENDTVVITGISDGWYETDEGYIRSDLITLIEEEEEVVEEDSTKESSSSSKETSSSSGKTQTSSSDESSASAKLPITIIETDEDINYQPEADGKDDYSSVEETTTSTSGNSSIVETAKQYLGVPYVWGGTSPSGFDCSGFTQYVFKQCGYSLSRVASDQYSNGIYVSYSNLQSGDLVFFERTYATNGISHVGIYIGDGQFIHCANGGVKISSLSETYYSSRYYGACRIS